MTVNEKNLIRSIGKKAKIAANKLANINGEIKKPTALYTDSRQKVKFGRLLKLKKSFIKEILDSAKEPVFK